MSRCRAAKCGYVGVFWIKKGNSFSKLLYGTTNKFNSPYQHHRVSIPLSIFNFQINFQHIFTLINIYKSQYGFDLKSVRKYELWIKKSSFKNFQLSTRPLSLISVQGCWIYRQNVRSSCQNMIRCIQRCSVKI